MDGAVLAVRFGTAAGGIVGEHVGQTEVVAYIYAEVTVEIVASTQRERQVESIVIVFVILGGLLCDVYAEVACSFRGLRSNYCETELRTYINSEVAEVHLGQNGNVEVAEIVRAFPCGVNAPQRTGVCEVCTLSRVVDFGLNTDVAYDHVLGKSAEVVA